MKQKFLQALTALKNFLKRFNAFLPVALPRTQEEFDTFVNDVCIPHGLPVSVNSKFAISTMLMHLPPICTHKSRLFFVKAIKKLQINEVAYDNLEAARKQQQPVATAPKNNA